jgi:hypothetical protein
MFFNKRRIGELESKLNEANSKLEMITNSSSIPMGIRDRIASIISGSNFTGDTMHDIALDFGYPETINFNMLWNMYRRFGIAKNAIELPVESSWTRNPCIESEDDQFMSDFDKLCKNTRLFQRLKALDRRQRVGRYAGLFVRVRDGKKPNEPLDGKLNGIASVMSVTPLYEGQLTVQEVDNDPASERFSLPVMYQFSGSAAGDRNEKSAVSFNIHWTRVILTSESADNGGIYGNPVLESCYNSLMDLRKIIGGGAEGFYKNSAQSVIFELKDAASASANTELLQSFNEKYDDFSKNRHRRSMWTPGLEAKPLTADMITAESFFNNALNDVAASVRIPATILIGQQTGRLASQEDSRGYLSTINSRNENYLPEMIGDVIDWFINNGVLPYAKYEVEFQDMLAMSDAELVANAKELAEINLKTFQAGKSAPFGSEEIRAQAGFEPMEEIDEGTEALDDDELDIYGD